MEVRICITLYAEVVVEDGKLSRIEVDRHWGDDAHWAKIIDPRNAVTPVIEGDYNWTKEPLAVTASVFDKRHTGRSVEYSNQREVRTEHVALTEAQKVLNSMSTAEMLALPLDWDRKGVEPTPVDLEREHARGYDAGYSAAIHDARVPGSKAHAALAEEVS